MSLTREDFKSKVSSRAAVAGSVEVPALGGTVYLRKLSAAGRDRVSAALLNLSKGGSYRARIVLETCCDETGAKLFTEADLSWLETMDWDILEPIVDKANDLNDFGGQEKK